MTILGTLTLDGLSTNKGMNSNVLRHERFFSNDKKYFLEVGKMVEIMNVPVDLLLQGRRKLISISGVFSKFNHYLNLKWMIRYIEERCTALARGQCASPQCPLCQAIFRVQAYSCARASTISGRTHFMYLLAVLKSEKYIEVIILSIWTRGSKKGRVLKKGDALNNERHS